MDSEKEAVQRYLASGREIFYGDLRSAIEHRSIFDFVAHILPTSTAPYGRYPRVRLIDDLFAIAKAGPGLVLVLENYGTLDADWSAQLLSFVALYVERNHSFLEAGKSFHLFLHQGAAPRIAN